MICGSRKGKIKYKQVQSFCHLDLHLYDFTAHMLQNGQLIGNLGDVPQVEGKSLGRVGNVMKLFNSLFFFFFKSKQFLHQFLFSFLEVSTHTWNINDLG